MTFMRNVSLAILVFLASCTRVSVDRDAAQDAAQDAPKKPSKALVIVNVRGVSVANKGIQGQLVFKKRFKSQNVFHKEIEVPFGFVEADKAPVTTQILHPGIYVLKRIILDNKENNSVALYAPVWFHVKAGEVAYLGDFSLKLKVKKLKSGEKFSYVDLSVNHNKKAVSNIMKDYKDIDVNQIKIKSIHYGERGFPIKKNKHNTSTLLTSRMMLDEAVEDTFVSKATFGGSNHLHERIQLLRNDEILKMGGHFILSIPELGKVEELMDKIEFELKENKIEKLRNINVDLQ